MKFDEIRCVLMSSAKGWTTYYLCIGKQSKSERYNILPGGVNRDEFSIATFHSCMPVIANKLSAMPLWHCAAFSEPCL